MKIPLKWMFFKMLLKSNTQAAKLLIKYDKKRLQDMEKIQEKYCIATEQLLLRKIKNSGAVVDVNNIVHATSPNGVIDLEIDISIFSNQIIELYDVLKPLEKNNFGIGSIDIALTSRL